MDRIHFFFSFELSYLAAPQEPSLGGVPEVGDQLPQKPLAVGAFIVQNGPTWSKVTRRASSLDRADISRLSPHLGSMSRQPSAGGIAPVKRPSQHQRSTAPDEPHSNPAR